MLNILYTFYIYVHHIYVLDDVLALIRASVPPEIASHELRKGEGEEKGVRRLETERKGGAWGGP